MIKKTILVFFLIIIILFEGMRMLFNPLMRSDEEIREKMLSQFPLGTRMDVVEQYAINKKGWSDIKIDNEHGYRKYAVLGEVIGEKYISVYIGEYRKITDVYMITDVQVFFGFNENSELIDIRVRKMTDSL